MLTTVNIQKGLFLEAPKFNYPKYLIMETFEAFSASNFLRSLNEVIDNPSPIVAVQVDSPGGFIYSLMGVLDTIDASPKPVMTFCTSWAMSCGLIALAAGTKGYRYMSKNATLMLHEAASSVDGKASDVKAELLELDRLNESIIELLAKYSNKNKKFYQTLMKKNSNNDFYITAKEALDWGIIDKIGIPKLQIEINATYKIS